MFEINSNVNLNIKNLLMLFIILTVLVVLYNKAFIDNNYVTIDKHKHIVKKYKLLIENYIKKIDELNQINEQQQLTIHQINNSYGQMQQIGNHSSAHNASLTPSRFNPSNDINLSTSINELLSNNVQQSFNNSIMNRQMMR